MSHQVRLAPNLILLLSLLLSLWVPTASAQAPSSAQSQYGELADALEDDGRRERLIEQLRGLERAA